MLIHRHVHDRPSLALRDRTKLVTLLTLAILLDLLCKGLGLQRPLTTARHSSAIKSAGLCYVSACEN